MSAHQNSFCTSPKYSRTNHHPKLVPFVHKKAKLGQKNLNVPKIKQKHKRYSRRNLQKLKFLVYISMPQKKYLGPVVPQKAQK